jgi:hypothetical protein
MTQHATEAQREMAAIIEKAVEGLRYRARAFRTIGMNLVADDLEFYADLLAPLPFKMFNAIGKDLDRDLAASAETSAGLMKLALSGVLKDSD